MGDENRKTTSKSPDTIKYEGLGTEFDEASLSSHVLLCGRG
jgi:hypothetical protein